jgi:hypothetical protein
MVDSPSSVVSSTFSVVKINFFMPFLAELTAFCDPLVAATQERFGQGSQNLHQLMEVRALEACLAKPDGSAVIREKSRYHIWGPQICDVNVSL